MDHLGCCKLCTYYIEKENKKNSMSGVAEGEGIREIKEKKLCLLNAYVLCRTPFTSTGM